MPEKKIGVATARYEDGSTGFVSVKINELGKDTFISIDDELTDRFIIIGSVEQGEKLIELLEEAIGEIKK